MKPQHVRFTLLLQMHVLSLTSAAYDGVQAILKEYPMLKNILK